MKSSFLARVPYLCRYQDLTLKSLSKDIVSPQGISYPKLLVDIHYLSACLHKLIEHRNLSAHQEYVSLKDNFYEIYVLLN